MKRSSSPSSGHIIWLLAILCLLLTWGHTVAADRRTNDILGLVNWAAGEYLGVDKPIVADSSSYGSRRYPPRHRDSYDEREQNGRRSAGRSDDRQQNGRRSAGRSDDRQRNGRRYDSQEQSGGGRSYYKGKRAPYSSESSGNNRPSAGRAGNRRETSLDDAISRVREQSQGRVLSAETVQQDNRNEHRVRIITDDGRVRRYRMDAETGNVLPRRR